MACRPTYKLIYFTFRGREGLCRMLFHAAGVPFEDVRLTREKFEARKSSLPFGRLPVLEIDGVVYAQSFGIAKYLAREFGFYGNTNLERLKIDEVLFQLVDLFPIVLEVFYDEDEAIKKRLRKEAMEVKLYSSFEYLEALLQKNQSGYFVGSQMTLADMATADFCTLIEHHKVYEVARCPVEIQKLVQRVSSHPKLVKFKYLPEREV